MTPIIISPLANDDQVPSTSHPPLIHLDEQVRNGPMNEANLLRLFGAIAQQAGWADLADELQRRAAAPASPSPPAEDPAKSVPSSPDTAAADAHQRQGIRLIKDGKLADAEDQFRRAIRLRPELADTHGNLGVVYARQGRLPEAEAAFRIAVRLNPTAVAPYTNLGTACLDQGKPAEAESWFRQALQLQPEAAETHRLLGAALEGRKKPAEAEKAYRQALRFKPDLAEGHFRLATLLGNRGQTQEAEAGFREAIRVQPQHAAAWNGLGMLLEANGKPAEAEACYRAGLRLQPDNVDLHNNLGVALAALDRYEEAEACYREALRLRPRFAAAHNNLGNALRVLDRLDDAARSLGEALRLQPGYAEAHSNLGIVLVHQGQVAEGMVYYDEALRLRPDYPDCRVNRALALLGSGDFARGCPEYEWRWRGRQQKPPQFPAPRWDGSPLRGRTILLTAEQGLGDTLQFVRYAELLHEAGTRVLVECQAELADILGTCRGVERVIPRGEPLPAFDVYAPLLSLPGLLGTSLENIPAPVPYLRADPDRVLVWQRELEGLAGLCVGIAWQGSKQHRGDRQRSVRLTQFAPLAALPGITLCSLQMGFGQEQLTEEAGARLGVRAFAGLKHEGFADTAALMKNLHLVITVDTAAAHLAGALGLPVWLALPFAADWRWFRGREDTPWYPTMRLFRQPARGDWDSVFEQMAEALREHGPGLLVQFQGNSLFRAEGGCTA